VIEVVLSSKEVHVVDDTLARRVKADLVLSSQLSRQLASAAVTREDDISTATRIARHVASLCTHRLRTYQ
jgi:hypothetical protein